MSDPITAILGTLLNRAILVSAVVVSMKLLADGIYVAAAGLILPLVFLVYLSFCEARLFH